VISSTDTTITPPTFADQRADLAIEALSVIAPAAEPADSVIRLLADLHHLADVGGLDLSRLARIARERHRVEVAEDQADAGDSWGGASDGLKLRTGQDRQPVKRGKSFHVGVTGKRRGPKRKRRGAAAER
jgi:hypothetical protein